MKRTRCEHMQWCKDRALGYVKSGNVEEAFSSMVSDLKKHAETESHPAMQLGIMLLMSGDLSSRCEMEKFINGFN